MPWTENDMRWFAVDLLKAVREVRRLTPAQLEQETNMASIQNVWINAGDDTEKKPMATIAEQLKAARAKLAEARQGAANAVADSADASKLVLQEAEKVAKEAADLRAEVAELTNGGPA